MACKLMTFTPHFVEFGQFIQNNYSGLAFRYVHTKELVFPSEQDISGKTVKVRQNVRRVFYHDTRIVTRQDQ